MRSSLRPRKNQEAGTALQKVYVCICVCAWVRSNMRESWGPFIALARANMFFLLLFPPLSDVWVLVSNASRLSSSSFLPLPPLISSHLNSSHSSHLTSSHSISSHLISSHSISSHLMSSYLILSHIISAHRMTARGASPPRISRILHFLQESP